MADNFMHEAPSKRLNFPIELQGSMKSPVTLG